ncbi:insulin-degrading enzyme [Planoprotostelium fungivorum]|uniref:Insulin-degrading enzyme n=1 Tax=Planoprotostelium fungivorum TaxID=1890364 RepID=A0A2P6NQT4_9EUKA|nr:insulin-degrading enzyme [Planoprotostelium fungivorum]
MDSKMLRLTPTKSQSDKRQYRWLKLQNELEAAASLCVRCGHLWNPPQVQGLAHFLEHMLFLGTEKYPIENSFQAFVKENGGSLNAYTSYEETCFHFEVGKDSLMPSLDRFSQFFICPTFTQSATDREMNAVNSEFEGNRNSDSWRYTAISHSIAEPSHPYSQFVVGNLKSLRDDPKDKGIDVRAFLIDFYNKYYSANVMKLCVLGNETLDELEAMVTPMFAPVVNRNISKLYPTHHQFFPHLPEKVFDLHELLKRPDYQPHRIVFPQEKCTPGWYNMVPKSDTNSLRLSWPCKTTLHEYETKPERYLGHLLGHEATGSLFALLKRLGWVTQLVAGNFGNVADVSMFCCNVALTLQGKDKVKEIITMIYQYLNLLKSQPPQEWVFEELRAMMQMDFNFLEKNSSGSHTRELSSRMQQYPPKDILSGPYLVHDWDAGSIDRLLNELTPENMLIIVTSKDFEGSPGLKAEQWFGAEYEPVKIDGDFFEGLKHLEPNGQFSIPVPNPFIPKDFTLNPEETTPHPQLIVDTPLLSLFWRNDNRFNMPKTHLMILVRPEISTKSDVDIVQFMSDESYSSPMNAAMITIFAQLCSDSLNEELSYYAELAGLAFHLSFCFEGLQLEATGYSEKVGVVVEQIVERMSKFQVKEERYRILKEQIMRDWDNQKTENGTRRAQSLCMETIFEKYWSSQQKRDALTDVTFEDLQRFIPKLLGRLKVVSLVQGSMRKSHAVQLLNNVIHSLNGPKPLLPAQIPERRIIKLTKGCNYYHLSNISNEHDKNSTIWSFYNAGIKSLRLCVLVELLANIMEVPLYNTLRTQEQLGYIVTSLHQSHVNTIGISVVIQSHHTAPTGLDARVEAFFSSFKESLDRITEEELQSYVKSLRSIKSQKFHKLGEEIGFNWLEICSREYFFDRKKKFVEELSRVSKSDLVELYDVMILNRETRRKISWHVYGCDREISSLEELMTSLSGNSEGHKELRRGPTQRGKIEGGPTVQLIRSGQEYLFRRELPYYPIGEKKE